MNCKVLVEVKEASTRAAHGTCPTNRSLAGFEQARSSSHTQSRAQSQSQSRSCQSGIGGCAKSCARQSQSCSQSGGSSSESWKGCCQGKIGTDGCGFQCSKHVWNFFIDWKRCIQWSNYFRMFHVSSATSNPRRSDLYLQMLFWWRFRCLWRPRVPQKEVEKASSRPSCGVFFPQESSTRIILSISFTRIWFETRCVKPCVVSMLAQRSSKFLFEDFEVRIEFSRDQSPRQTLKTARHQKCHSNSSRCERDAVMPVFTVDTVPYWRLDAKQEGWLKAVFLMWSCLSLFLLCIWIIGIHK